MLRLSPDSMETPPSPSMLTTDPVPVAVTQSQNLRPPTVTPQRLQWKPAAGTRRVEYSAACSAGARRFEAVKTDRIAGRLIKASQDSAMPLAGSALVYWQSATVPMHVFSSPSSTMAAHASGRLQNMSRLPAQRAE